MALLCVGLVGLAACDPQDGRDLAVSVPDPPSTMVLGESVSFEAILSNVGDAAATGTTLAVVAPLGIDVAVAAPAEVECRPPEHAPDLDGMAVTCEVGTVAPSAELQVEVTLSNDGAVAGGEVTVSARSTGGREPAGGGAADTVAFPLSVTAPQQVDLHVEAAPFEVPPAYGSTVESRTTITNRGAAPASPVTVTQTFPDGFTLGAPALRRSGAGGVTGACSVTGLVATCSTGAHAVDPLADPTDRWEMVVPATATSGGYAQVVHTASSPLPEPDPDPHPNTATVTTWRNLAYLGIAAPPTVAVGSSFTATVYWVGGGFGQYISGSIPSNLRLERISGQPFALEGCSGSGSISCSGLGPFIGGGSSITLELTALEVGGPETLSLFINSEAGAASGWTSIEVVDPTITSDVHPSFPAPAFGLLGEPVTITGEVRTAGPTPHEGVTATLELPGGSVAHGATWGPDHIPCGVAARTVTCAVGALGGHEQVPIELVMTSYALGPAAIGVSVTSSTPQDVPDPWPDAVTVSFPIRHPFVDLGVTASHAPDPPTQGNLHETTFTVKNHGSELATGVVLTVDVPDGFQPTSAQQLAPVVPGGTGCALGGVVTCGIGPLASGATQRVIVRSIAGPPGAVTYVATVEGDQPEPVPDEQPSTVTVAVAPQAPTADLEVALPVPTVVDPMLVGVQQSLAARIVNQGPSSVTGAYAQVLVPAGWRLDAVVGTGAAGCTIAGNTANCTPRPLAATRVWDLGILATPLEAGLDRPLTVTAGSELPDPDPSSNTATRLLDALAVEVDLGVSSPSYLFGQSGTHVVQVRNLGPATATDVVLTGHYPDVVTIVDVDIDVFGDFPCTWTAHDFTCPMPDVGTGFPWSVTVSTVTEEVPGPLTYDFTVTSAQPEASPEVLPNTAQVEVIHAGQIRGFSGTVTRPGGAAVAGATVRVYAEADTVFPTALAVTAADGSWSALNLAPGTYRIRINPPTGSGLPAEWYQDKPTRALATPLSVNGTTPHHQLSVIIG